MTRVPFLCLAGFALLFAACSKDDAPDRNGNTPPPEPARDIAYVASMATHTTFGDSVVFEYNADKTLKRQGAFEFGRVADINTFIYYPHYENGRIKSLYLSRAAADVAGEPRFEIVYNNAGQVIRTNDVTPAANGGFTAYNYNSDGHIIDKRMYGTSAKTDSVVWTFTWEGKNVTKVIMTNSNFGNPYTETYTYTYDDKWNPFTGRTLGIFTNSFELPYYYSENNVKKQVLVDGSDSYTTTYEYQYNSDGYPVHFAASEVTEGDPTVYTEATDITYLPK
ncbi:hypothetical protein F0L74_21985 [Chitinophaga agrisoli]|uniref:YD repeat-containing protein n=1 Tax=Chitinophaga agrisoli TaxID=2607653 RepID=A0A5B2VKV4_9BACT|nr:hypothetical protein [Chitinophaga agrisoli]KAA2238887.1 hypothetical protein F0L74_21985 [Chitinophaga agrisoli]